MSTRLLYTACLSAIVLTACATRQQNPFYKYSSNYPAELEKPVQEDFAQADTTSTAGDYKVVVEDASLTDANVVQTSARDVQVKKSDRPWTVKVVADPRLTIVEGDCLTRGTVVPCEPVEMPITQSHARISEPYQSPQSPVLASNTTDIAPTDRQYGGDLTGTPGYYAMQSSEPDYVVIEQNHLYADQTPADGTTIAPAMIEAGTATRASSEGVMLHRVITGDTVYSLARSSCTSVSAIKAMNGLEADFKIRLGEMLRLPVGAC